MLQQYLPLAVLKQSHTTNDQANFISVVATVLTACGIETIEAYMDELQTPSRCNSAYRLRYATKGARQQRSEATMRPAHL